MDKSLYSSEQKIFLALLREAREAAGITQTGLAERLGWTQVAVSKVERGDRRLDVLELRQWVRAIDQDLALFTEELDSRLVSHEALLKANRSAKPTGKH